MNYKYINVIAAEHVTTIELCRPEVLNAINQQMHDELQSAFDEFAGDEQQYIAVVRGAGQRAFSAGSDLKAIAEAGKPNTYPKNGYAGLIERYDLNKPIIAAVDGVAVGGGFEVALACDILVATSRSRFGLPEPKIGAIALGGGVHRLARQIGLKKAMGLILSADIIDATQGEKLGFITELVEAEDLDESVDRWCHKILQCAPLAIRASKETVMRGLDEPSLEQAMSRQVSYPEFESFFGSKDRHEGALAFAEKRPPRWRGE